MSVRKAVVAVVFKKDESKEEAIKFLVLHRCLGWQGWEFPKGGVERQDITDENAVKREVFEETGLKNIRIIGKVPFEIRYKYPIKYQHKYKHSETVQSVYLVRAFDDKIILSAEHDEFKWLAYGDVKKLLAWNDQKKALDAARKELKV